MNENEIQPWLVVIGSSAATRLAMWQIGETQKPALALFSNSERATQYAIAHIDEEFQVTQPARTALLTIMIECYRGQMEHAVLDPDSSSAKRVFVLRDVLKAAREELR